MVCNGTEYTNLDRVIGVLMSSISPNYIDCKLGSFSYDKQNDACSWLRDPDNCSISFGGGPNVRVTIAGATVFGLLYKETEH